MTDEQKMALGDEANTILRSQAFNLALEKLAETYVGVWKIAETQEGRENAHKYYLLCEKFAQDLKSMLLEGSLTRKRVKELGKKKRWGV